MRCNFPIPVRKVFFLVSSLLILSQGSYAQEKSTLGKKLIKVIVEAGCGRCCFKSKGTKKCSLSVRINGQVYHVQGKDLHDFGKPKKKHGLCRMIRHAEVSGEIVNNNFMAYDFVLLPLLKKELPLKEEGQSPPIENKM